MCRNKNLAKKAKIIRWFGIDRPKKQGGTWENDIVDVGYKYQMTDIGAALLLDSMEEFNFIKKRNQIHDIYKKELTNVPGLACLKNNNKKHKPVIWLTTILCDRKDFLQKKLRTKLMKQIKFILEMTGIQYLKNFKKF